MPKYQYVHGGRGPAITRVVSAARVSAKSSPFDHSFLVNFLFTFLEANDLACAAGVNRLFARCSEHSRVWTELLSLETNVGLGSRGFLRYTSFADKELDCGLGGASGEEEDENSSRSELRHRRPPAQEKAVTAEAHGSEQRILAPGGTSSKTRLLTHLRSEVLHRQRLKHDQLGSRRVLLYTAASAVFLSLLALLLPTCMLWASTPVPVSHLTFSDGADDGGLFWNVRYSFECHGHLVEARALYPCSAITAGVPAGSQLLCQGIERGWATETLHNLTALLSSQFASGSLRAYVLQRPSLFSCRSFLLPLTSAFWYPILWISVSLFFTTLGPGDLYRLVRSQGRRGPSSVLVWERVPVHHFVADQDVDHTEAGAVLLRNVVTPEEVTQMNMIQPLAVLVLVLLCGSVWHFFYVFALPPEIADLVSSRMSWYGWFFFPTTLVFTVLSLIGTLASGDLVYNFKYITVHAARARELLTLPSDAVDGHGLGMTTTEESLEPPLRLGRSAQLWVTVQFVPQQRRHVTLRAFLSLESLGDSDGGQREVLSPRVAQTTLCINRRIPPNGRLCVTGTMLVPADLPAVSCDSETASWRFNVEMNQAVFSEPVILVK